MKYNNSKLAVWLPIIIAGSLALGIFAGQFVNSSSFSSEKTKIDEVFQYINKYYVDDIPLDSIQDVAITELLHNLDPHSYYMTADETAKSRPDLDGNFTGIGITFYVLHDTVTVMSIIEDGGASKAGLKAGDRIISADSVNIAGIGIKSDSVKNYLCGSEGTIVNVDVIRDGKKLNFDITRAPINIESVHYCKIDDIGYIKISSFSDNTGEQFADAVANLEKMNISSLVIDLRDNSGGYMHAAKQILDNFFNDKTLLVYTKGNNVGEEKLYSTGRGGSCSKYKLAVLVNEGSASASEILAGVLQDYDKGTIIGNITFGKGLVQRMFDLNDGSTLRLTVARYYLPSGRCIQRNYANGYISYIEDYYLNYGKNKQNIDTTKVFYTKAGRKVYEGDGLMPDVIVEHDTSFYTPLVRDIASSNILADFCSDYYDSHRKVFEEFGIDNLEDLTSFLDADHVFQQFLGATEKNISDEKEIDSASYNYLKNLVYYRISMNYLDTNKSLQILLQNDNYFGEAKKMLKK